jgi:branched-chain amino acid transport system substrate-binding protein
MDFLINQSKKTTGGGVVLGDGLNHTMELVVADSQSDGARAAQVAGDLIQNSKVDLVMSGGGPEVVLPVADQCEAMGVPSLSTNTPWEPWVFARKGAMDKAFKWTYLACGGITEFMQADVHTIGLVPTNKKVRLLLANTADGQAWADPKTGFPPALAAAGFRLVFPGLYPPGVEDFTAQIGQFKKGGARSAWDLLPSRILRTSGTRLFNRVTIPSSFSWDCR